MIRLVRNNLSQFIDCLCYIFTRKLSLSCLKKSNAYRNIILKQVLIPRMAAIVRVTDWLNLRLELHVIPLHKHRKTSCLESRLWDISVMKIPQNKNSFFNGLKNSLITLVPEAGYSIWIKFSKNEFFKMIVFCFTFRVVDFFLYTDANVWRNIVVFRHIRPLS